MSFLCYTITYRPGISKIFFRTKKLDDDDAHYNGGVFSVKYSWLSAFMIA